MTTLLTFDSKSVESGKKALSGLGKQLENIRAGVAPLIKTGGAVGAATGTPETVKQSQTHIAKLNEQIAAVQRKIESIDPVSSLGEWEREAERIEQLKKEYQKLTEEVKDYSGAREDAEFGMPDAGGGGGVGKLQGAGRFAQSIGGMFGGQGEQFNQFSQATSGVADLAEQLGGMQSTLRTAATGAKAAGTAISSIGSGIPIIGKVTGALGGLVGGLGGTGATGLASVFGAVSAAALPLGAALAGLSLVMADQNKATQKAIDLRRAQVEDEMQLREIESQWSSEQIEQRKEDLQGQLEAMQAARDAEYAAQMADQSLQASIDNWRTGAEAGLNMLLGRSLEGTTIYGMQADAAREYQTQVEAINRELANLDEADDIVAQREAAEAAAQQVADAEQDLIGIREELTQSEQQFADELAQRSEDMAFQRKRELEDRQREDERAEEDHQRELQRIEADSEKSIENMRKDNAKALADMAEDFVQGEVEAQKQLSKGLADLDKQTAQAEADLNKDYMKSELQAQEQFLRDMSRADAEYGRERLRRLQDLNESLDKAQSENDVLAFIEAQKSGEKDLQRMAEDANLQRSEAEEQFQLEREEARQQRDQQLADIRQSAIDQRAEMQRQFEEDKAARAEAYAAQIEEQKKQLEEQIANEKEARAEQLKAARDAFAEQRKLQEEERAYQDKRAQEDAQRELDRMMESHQREIAAIQDREKQALDIIQGSGKGQVKAISDSMSQIGTAITTAFSGIAQQVSSIASSIRIGGFGGGNDSSALGYGGGGNTFARTRIGGGGGRMVMGGGTRVRPRRFAEGGVVDEPTLALLGDKYPGQKEVVLPMNKFQPGTGLNQAGLGASYEFNFSGMSIGSDVSRTEIQNELRMLAMTIVQAVSDSQASTVKAK